MKFCIPYKTDFRYLKEVDEVLIKYNDNIIDFVLRHFTNQRIVIDLAESYQSVTDALPIIRKLQQDYKGEIVLLINEYLYDVYRKDIYDAVKCGIPYFFNEYCRTKENVYTLVKKGVSDIYVVEELGFNLKDVSEYCHANNVKVRIYPNVAQYGPLHSSEVPAMTTFFVRPEDMDLYAEFVDVFELLPGVDDRLSVLFEIYKDKQWLGNLSDLLVGFDEVIPNAGIYPCFGAVRVNCGHKCMLGKCDLCPHMQEVAEKFKDLNLEIKRPRDKEWRINELKITEETMLNEQKTDTSDADKVFEK